MRPLAARPVLAVWRGFRFPEGRAGQRVSGMGEGVAGPAFEAGGGGADAYKRAALSQLHQPRGVSRCVVTVKGNWSQAPIHSDIRDIQR